MKRYEQPHEKGYGLTLLLSIVVFLFMIGLIIFIFALFGGELSNATATTELGNLVNDTITFQQSCDDTSVAGLNDIQLSNVVVALGNGTVIPPSNYTVVGGAICAN